MQILHPNIWVNLSLILILNLYLIEPSKTNSKLLLHKTNEEQNYIVSFYFVWTSLDQLSPSDIDPRHR